MPRMVKAEGYPTKTQKRPLKVNFYYMVGNHDWYYHLKGEAFDEIRRVIVEKWGCAIHHLSPSHMTWARTGPNPMPNIPIGRRISNEGNNDAGKIKDLIAAI